MSATINAQIFKESELQSRIRMNKVNYFISRWTCSRGWALSEIFAFNEIRPMCIGGELFSSTSEKVWFRIVRNSLSQWEIWRHWVCLLRSFEDYFPGCKSVSIPGRTFPVKSYYLEHALSLDGTGPQVEVRDACKHHQYEEYRSIDETTLYMLIKKCRSVWFLKETSTISLSF